MFYVYMQPFQIQRINIKRIDKGLPLPGYKTAGAVAFDLTSRIMTTISPGEIAYVPLNVCIRIPEGHALIITARSSLHKRGLMLVNGVGVGDGDFSGNLDEYVAALYNFTDAPVTVERGDRIVQGLMVPVVQCGWDEVEDMGGVSRGGFGTTGVA